MPEPWGNVRDLIALEAMKAIVSNPAGEKLKLATVVRNAYLLADAMLAERQKEPSDA